MTDIDMEEEDNMQDTPWLGLGEDKDLKMQDNRGQESVNASTGEDNSQRSEDMTMDDGNMHQSATQTLGTRPFVRSKKKTRSNPPCSLRDLPYREGSTTWSTHPGAHPRAFVSNTSPSFEQSSLHRLPTPTYPPRKSKKREFDGNVKEMVAELNARTDLVISRESTPPPTPRGRRTDRVLPSPGYWQWDTLGLSPLIFRPSPMSPRRTLSRNVYPVEADSSDVTEQHEEDHGTERRKRKGSLLEWRDKERFEEPVRI